MLSLLLLLLLCACARTRQDIVMRFRWLYRHAWSRAAMSAVLRVGAHWMVPDDHDLVNNADAGLNNVTGEWPADPTCSRVSPSRAEPCEYHPCCVLFSSLPAWAVWRRRRWR
jgi:hypothetical protein